VKANARLPDREAINARPWRKAAPPERILAIRIQALGDTVLTLPYLAALRRSLPHTELDFLTRYDYRDIPAGVGLFENVFAVEGMTGKAQACSAVRAMPALRSRRYDIVLDLQRNRVSRFIRHLLRPSAWSEFDRFSAELAGERTRRTIEALGLGVLDVYPVEPRDPNAGLERLVAAGWNGRSDLIALNPAGLSADRHWPIERWASLARSLSGRHEGTAFVILGLAKISARAAELKAALGDRLMDLVERTSLQEAMAIVRRVRLMVSEDGGLMHVAWSLGVPTVGIFGASRPVWARPHGNYSRVVVACREPDGVCMDGRCRRGARGCLAGLPIEPVLAACSAALAGASGERVISEAGRPVFSVDDTVLPSPSNGDR
jgi:ADP-heptose:LPS heptosyltransferase